MSEYYKCLECNSEMIDTKDQPHRISPCGNYAANYSCFSCGSDKVIYILPEDLTGNQIRELWERNTVIKSLQEENKKLKGALEMALECEDREAVEEYGYQVLNEVEND